jgi:glycosyltransferase involved in cell wall biosynthesis
MNIILFAHPSFLGSESMPRFANYLLEGMRSRGHKVELWAPSATLHNYTSHPTIKKWLGYIDQYILFPREVYKHLKTCSSDTLFVFTDQALGPWVPMVKSRPHVIHCHDFLAQHSALGRIPENPTSWTGRIYQKFIRKGYTKGQHFISVSQTTREDLIHFLPALPFSSDIVYNGLNKLFAPFDLAAARNLISQRTGLDLRDGYLLHVGGNQWYKNRIGCIELYNAWRTLESLNIPLLLIGETPNEAILQLRNESVFKDDIHFLSGFTDELVRFAYAGGTVFLFPSLAEGFGWPIAEAMAAGCPVITTRRAPMTEVGGEAAFYISPRPDSSNVTTWATISAHVIQQVVELCPAKRQAVVEAGLANASRFDSIAALDQIEAIYQTVLHTYTNE